MTEVETSLLKVVGILAGALGSGIWIIRRFVASRREPADVRANREIMDAIEKLAERLRAVEQNTGKPCVFLDGRIPDHVETWMRLQIAEIDRKKGRT